FGAWQIPASHVIYGTRIATMIVSGAGELSFAKFALMDMLGCVAFTSIFVTLGFLFSSSASLIIGHVNRVELFLLLATMFIALVFDLINVCAQRLSGSSEKCFRRAYCRRIMHPLKLHTKATLVASAVTIGMLVVALLVTSAGIADLERDADKALAEQQAVTL